MEIIERFYRYGCCSLQDFWYRPLTVYGLGSFNLSLSVISLTVGALKPRLPKEEEGKVELASGTEVDEEQLDPRSDDDDT